MLHCSYCLSWRQHTQHRQQQLTFTKCPWAPDIGSPLGWWVTHRPISDLFSRQNCWSIFSDFSIAGKTLESALKTTTTVWSPPSEWIYFWELKKKGICRVRKTGKSKYLSSNTTSSVHSTEKLCLQQHSRSWCHSVIHSTNIYWVRYWRYGGELEGGSHS